MRSHPNIGVQQKRLVYYMMRGGCITFMHLFLTIEHIILYYIAATFQYQYEQEINRIWTAS